jgi:hypothetical protein
MRFGIVVLLLALPLRAEQESCTTHCHGKESKAFRESVHAEVLACVDCHGGDPTAQRDKSKSHDPAKGYRGTPSRLAIPELCGECHSDPLRMHAYGLPTDQLAHYRASPHGKLLTEQGVQISAVCTDCHGTHGVLAADDPRAPSARPRQPEACGRCHIGTVEHFKQSVHGWALLRDRSRGAPSCSDCHGSHGAAPPGVADVDQICGHCHRNTRDEYRRSAHFRSGKVQCTTCHGAHATAKSGPWLYRGEEEGRCGSCHDQGDGSQAVIDAILDGTRRLREAMDTSLDVIREAKQSGLFLENERVYLLESQRALVSVQPLAHSLDEAAIARHLEVGLERQERTRETIRKKQRILRDRTLILSALALLVLLLTGLLVVKLGRVRRLS